MQLSKETIKLIQNAVKTARVLKLDSIAVEEEQIRALNANHTIMVCEKDVPELEFTGLGIGRVQVLQSRLAMLEGEDDFVIEATLLPNGVVRQLDISAGGTKVEYRCANPSSIKAPRNMKVPDMWSFTINEKTLNMLSKACSSVSSESVTIRSNSKGEMLMTITDESTNDKFTQRFDADVQNVDDEDGTLEFEFRYQIETFLMGLKGTGSDKDGNIVVNLTQVGGIKTVLNNTTVYIIPLADETDNEDD
jgi:hypothetical protein